MFAPYGMPIPGWAREAGVGARRLPGEPCRCPACAAAAPLDIEVLDAAELFRRHPYAHLEL